MEQTVETKSKRNFAESVKETIKFVIISIAIVVPFRMWVAQPFIVSGASMEPNFKSGDYLIIDELTYKFKEPERGEVIIIKAPGGSVFYIKRIVGLPYEKIEIKQNKVFISQMGNGGEFELKENYINGADTYPDGVYKLKEKEYLVFGDNRPRSLDSREFGPIAKNSIIGKVLLRLWPINGLGFAGKIN